jgi:hypothetical protein
MLKMCCVFLFEHLTLFKVLWWLYVQQNNVKRLRILPKQCLDQVVRQQHLRVEDVLLSQNSPCGICNRKSGTGKDFPQSALVFPCQYHSTSSPHYISLTTTDAICMISGNANFLEYSLFLFSILIYILPQYVYEFWIILKISNDYFSKEQRQNFNV